MAAYVARLRHGRFLALVGGSFKALGEGARALIQIPVEGFREGQTLRNLEAQSVNVIDEKQQRGKLLAALRHQPEFRRLLDRS